MFYHQLLCLAIMAFVISIIYFVLPKRFKYISLLVSSIVFLFYFSTWLVFFTFITSLAIYLTGILINNINANSNDKKASMSKDEWKKYKLKVIKKKKLALFIGILVVIGALFSLKYINFFNNGINKFLDLFKSSKRVSLIDILLPLGISYYSLSAIGYMVDVYRGKYVGEKNFFKVLLFIVYFPALLEGPVARFDRQGQSYFEGHSFDAKRFYKGFILILLGIFKKIVIADRLSILVGEVFKNYSQYGGYIVVIGVIAFTIQLYTEFSGIIDIARGVSEIYGIELEQNFDHPFLSKNVAEFWRRWHISLGTWFKDYVFYPVSMSKPFMKLNKKLKGHTSRFLQGFIPTAFALFVVWLLTGLWHGASMLYVCYGLFYYLIMMLENVFGHLTVKFKYKKSNFYKIYSIIRTFIIVNIGMLMFRSGDLNQFYSIFKSIFMIEHKNIFKIIELKELVVALIFIIVLICIGLIENHGIKLREKLVLKPLYVKYLIVVVLIICIVIFGAYGNGYQAPDPIYGGF